VFRALADSLDDATIGGEGENQREDKVVAMSPVLEPPVIAQTDPARDSLVEPVLAPGTRVEVRNRLDGDWARGFEVINVDAEGYRLRRLSDGGELPMRFHEDDIRKEKKRGTWWY
jgi:hypothetical protein